MSTAQPLNTRSALAIQARKRGVLSREEERKLAHAVIRERDGLWRAILSYPPLVNFIVEELKSRASEIEERSRSDLRKLDISKLRNLLRVNTMYRKRHAKKEREQLDKALESTAKIISQYDDCGDIATCIREELQKPRPFDSRKPPPGGVYPAYIRGVELAYKRYVAHRNLFVEKNYGLVMVIARRYYKSPIPQEDLIQEGIFGLTKAIGRFDPERGFKFSTYATWWIRHHISRHIHNRARLVRVPVHLISKMEKYLEAQRLIEERKDFLSDESIARESGLPLKTVQELNLYSLKSYRSADTQNEAGSTILDAMQSKLDHSMVEQNEDFRLAMGVVDKLDERSRDIIVSRFGIGKDPETLAEIGKRHNLSRERVRQLESKALEALRSKFAHRNNLLGLFS